MARVLVTGFEPYGNTPVNPAQLTAEALDGWVSGDIEVVGPDAPGTPALPHVAALDENLGSPSMTVDTAVEGLELAVEAAVARHTDIHVPIHSRLQI